MKKIIQQIKKFREKPINGLSSYSKGLSWRWSPEEDKSIFRKD